jgi:hypothetical protein
MILIRSTKVVEELQAEIEKLLRQNSLGMFLVDPISEPFGERYTDHVALSIADDNQHDNCEMFLLPDNCSYNGKINPMPFSERMQVFRAIALLLRAHGYSAELFLGTSGTDYSEYTAIRCSAEEIARILAVSYYIRDMWQERDLHVIID